MRSADTINDLVRINNDRIEGYHRAAQEIREKDKDLYTVFDKMAKQSSGFAEELKELVRSENQEPAEGATGSGKIYRAWMDLKATFTGNNRKGILASCEFGEDAAQKAYRTALEEPELPTDVRNVIEHQQMELRRSHDEIKRMRDSNPAS